MTRGADPQRRSRWVVTGGAGFIGGNTVREMQRSGFDIVVIDDFSSGRPERIPAGVQVSRLDVRDLGGLVAVLRSARVEGVVHLAAQKSIALGESRPGDMWDVNVVGMHVLLAAMEEVGVGRMVFASSAAVYAPSSDDVPLSEQATLGPVSVYGRSKAEGERLVEEAAVRGAVTAIVLRYFNVVGAGGPELREFSRQALVPKVLQVAQGEGVLEIQGDDYPTADGTCVRDYVDVGDVARANLAAVTALERSSSGAVCNVATATPTSVAAIVAQVETVSQRHVRRTVGPRRQGDLASVVGDRQQAMLDLGWAPRVTLEESLRNAWEAEPQASTDR